MFCVGIQHGRQTRFEVESRGWGVRKENLLVTSTEKTTGVVREVEGEEARNGNKDKVIAVKEVIVLDEKGTRGRGKSGESRIRCSRGKGSWTRGCRGGQKVSITASGHNGNGLGNGGDALS